MSDINRHRISTRPIRDTKTGVVTTSTHLSARKVACGRCGGTAVPRTIGGQTVNVCTDCGAKTTSRRI